MPTLEASNTYFQNQLSSASQAASDSVPLTLDEYRAKERKETGGIIPGTKRNYKQYLEEFNRSRDAAQAADAENSARQWEEYMSSTAYSRAYEDLKRAGVNPRLILDNAGAASTPSAQSSYTTSSSRSSSESKTTSQSLSTSALVVGLIALLLKGVKKL